MPYCSTHMNETEDSGNQGRSDEGIIDTKTSDQGEDDNDDSNSSESG